MLEVANSTHERNSEDVSHLDGCADNSPEITHMAEVVPPDALSVALAELPPSLALKVRDSYAQEFQRAAVPQPVLATTAGLSALGKIVEQVTRLVAGIRRLAGGL